MRADREDKLKSWDQFLRKSLTEADAASIWAAIKVSNPKITPFHLANTHPDVWLSTMAGWNLSGEDQGIVYTILKDLVLPNSGKLESPKYCA